MRVVAGRDRGAVEKQQPAMGMAGGVVDVNRDVVLDGSREVVDDAERRREGRLRVADVRIQQPVATLDFVDCDAG